MMKMRNTTLALGYCAVIGILCDCAQAQIYAEYLSGGNWIAVQGSPWPSGSHFTIANTGIRTYRVRTGSATVDDIGGITITESAGATLLVGTGSDVLTPGVPLPNAGARNLGSITDTTGNLRLQVRVNGAITSFVDAYDVARIDADSISGTITHNASGATPDPFPATVVANSISGTVRSFGTASIVFVWAVNSLSGQVRSYGGSIGTVNVGQDSSDDLQGSIIAEQGSISTILVTGRIKSQNDPNGRVSIRARDGIFSITAGSIYADITANYGNTGGNLRVLNTTSAITDGDVVGTITCANVTSNPPVNAMDIMGDFHASLTASGIINRAIVIRRSFNGSITAGSSTVGGIQHTIFINASGGGSWTSNADIHHHGPNTALAPRRHYLQSTTAIGGGSVAEVNYHYHPVDCEPDDDAIITDIGQIPTTVTMHWYGPVTTWITSPPPAHHYNPQVEWPLRVYERNLKVIGGQPVDVSSRFIVTITNSISRVATIQARPGQTGFRVGYEYSFRPVQSTSGSFVPMLCHDVIDGVANSGVPNPPAYDDTADPYSFQIPVVTLDLNQSGEIDPGDAAVWLDNPVDVNADQSTDTLDLEEIIDAIE